MQCLKEAKGLLRSRLIEGLGDGLPDLTYKILQVASLNVLFKQECLQGSVEAFSNEL